MSPHELLTGFLLWVLYPAWLLAGATDYFCHRRTDIARTSGSAESWLHFAELVCLAIAFALVVLLRMSAVVFTLTLGAVIAHSALSFVDVSYTDGRRYISPLEQQVHGYMEVIPWIAVALVGILNWDDIRGAASQPAFALKTAWSAEQGLLLASFAVLAGAPIIEELIRTRRQRRPGHGQRDSRPASMQTT